MVSKAAALDGAIALGMAGALPKESSEGTQQSAEDSSPVWIFLDLVLPVRQEYAVAARLGTGVMKLGVAAALDALPTVSLADGGKDDTTGGVAPAALQSKLEVIESAKKHFSEFDENGNGFMAPKELAKQVGNQKIKGELAQTVAVLYGMGSKLDFSSDED